MEGIQMGLQEQGEKLAKTLEKVAEHIFVDNLQPHEILALLVGASLLRMVSPMRLSRAIEEGRKKFESLTTEGESNQGKTRG